MNSIVRENSSIPALFYLFCSFLFLNQPVTAQEVLWNYKSGIPQPHITFLGQESKEQRLLISSPFVTTLSAIQASTGLLAWQRKFVEEVPYPPLALTEDVLVQGDQGTIWTLNNDSGESRWETRAPDFLDFPVSPTYFRKGFLYTLGRKAVLRKIDTSGKIVDVKFLQNSWGSRRARIVPLRSSQNRLTYLDQSGRLNSLTNKTQNLKTLQLWENGPRAARAYGRTREVVAGAMSPSEKELWTVELPGFLKSTRLFENRTLWSRKLWKEREFWSTEGTVIAVPTALRNSESSAILIVTQEHANLLSPQTGRILERKVLPSKAVAPPTFDRLTQTWWLLCEQHLLRLQSQNEFSTYGLPIDGKAFSMKVRDNLAVIATIEGSIYGMRMGPDTLGTLGQL